MNTNLSSLLNVVLSLGFISQLVCILLTFPKLRIFVISQSQESSTNQHWSKILMIIYHNCTWQLDQLSISINTGQLKKSQISFQIFLVEILCCDEHTKVVLHDIFWCHPVCYNCPKNGFQSHGCSQELKKKHFCIISVSKCILFVDTSSN